MKFSHLVRLILAASVVFSGAAGLAAAPKIGVLLKAKNPFWNAMEKGALEAGEKLGVEVIVKAPLAESDIGVQVQLVNALAGQGVQAIVIAPSSKDGLVEPLKAVIEKGIKVVIVDTELTTKISPVFVGTDQREAGRAAGRLLAEHLSESDVLSIFKHSQTSGATIERELGALEILRERFPNLTIHGDVYSSTEKGVEHERAKLLLQKHADTNAILASSTPGTTAMLQVLRETNQAGSVKFIGFGFNLNPTIAEALESGAMLGWVAQLPSEAGAEGVKAALAMVNGDTPPAVVNTRFVVITKNNLNDAAVQALLQL